MKQQENAIKQKENAMQQKENKLTGDENVIPQKENEARQRELLRKFDKELYTYTRNPVAWFPISIVTILCLSSQIIPAQDIWADSHVWSTALVFIALIPSLVLSPYVNTAEPFIPNQKISRTYDKLKYLPVNRKQYRIVRMGYLFHYVWKVTIAGLALQCAVSLAAAKYLDIWNIVYPISILFVLPLIGGWLWLKLQV